jgi:hypothetical protein
VDPTTGDITFHNTDGSTSVLKFDQDAGAYEKISGLQQVRVISEAGIP